jgi:hypothetical protein
MTDHEEESSAEFFIVLITVGTIAYAFAEYLLRTFG